MSLSKESSGKSTPSRGSKASDDNLTTPSTASGAKKGSVFGELQVSDAEAMMVILDYIRLRCLEASFYWKPAYIDMPLKDTPLLIASRRLCREYEDAVRRKFRDMHLGAVHVDSPVAKTQFKEVLDEAFQDAKYSWGRIAGVIVFGAQLAIQAFTINKPELIPEVVKWTYDFLQTKPIKDYIAEKGGWEALVKEFQQRPSVFRDLFGEPHTFINTVVVTLAAGIFGSVVIHKLIGGGTGNKCVCRFKC